LIPAVKSPGWRLTRINLAAGFVVVDLFRRQRVSCGRYDINLCIVPQPALLKDPPRRIEDVADECDVRRRADDRADSGDR
jgi:hypothetical protein